MRTSNKLLMMAVLILLCTLAVYNIALKAEYNKGDFRDPFKEYTSLNLKDFNSITVNGASSLNVEVIQGDFQVRVFEKLADYIKVSVQEQELVVDLEFPEEYNMPQKGADIIISLPSLSALKTDAVYTVAGKKQVDKVYREWRPTNKTVSIKGMELGSLVLQQDNGSMVMLTKNKIGSLHATTGLSTGSAPKLVVNSSNVIRKANLDIRSGSELVLENVAIPDLTYEFSDSAKTVLSGSSLAILKQ